MFDKLRKRLKTWEDNLEKSDPRLAYLLVLQDILINQPISRQHLENIITFIEQTKFSKTWPTFFQSNFTLRTLLYQDRKETEFLNKPCSQAEEISEYPLHPNQIRSLPYGVLNDEFTGFLMDTHKELMNIYQLLPKIYNISREQMRNSQALQNLQQDLQEDYPHGANAAADLGRGTLLQGKVIPENATQEEKVHLLFDFAKGAEKAVSAVFQHVYAHLGLACGELFESRDQNPSTFAAGTGRLIWKKQHNQIYADIYYAIAALEKDGKHYLLNPENKRLQEASDGDFTALTQAIRERTPLPSEPVYSCQGRLDLAADSQGVLRPYLSSLVITLNCMDLKARQQALLYSPKAIHNSAALSEWELQASSTFPRDHSIIEAMENELENTLNFEGNPIKFIYALENTQDNNHPKIEVYAFQDRKNNFYILNSANEFIKQTKEQMTELTQKKYAALKPFCIAETEIIDNKKIRAFECTFNAQGVDSSVKTEARPVKRMADFAVTLK